MTSPRVSGFRSLSAVRAEIDRIDRTLVPLLAARGQAVRAAARAPRRAARVLANARRLARRHGMDPALAARIYRSMIAAFVEDEMVEHARPRRAGRQGRSR